jgi:hypothetical protein
MHVLSGNYVLHSLTIRRVIEHRATLHAHSLRVGGLTRFPEEGRLTTRLGKTDCSKLPNSANRALLPGDELVRPTEKYLGGKVPTRFAAKRALNSDGLKGELNDAGWNVAAAFLARNYEALPISGHLEHDSIISK